MPGHLGCWAWEGNGTIMELKAASLTLSSGHQPVGFASLRGGMKPCPSLPTTQACLFVVVGVLRSEWVKERGAPGSTDDRWGAGLGSEDFGSTGRGGHAGWAMGSVP